MEEFGEKIHILWEWTDRYLIKSYAMTFVPIEKAQSLSKFEILNRGTTVMCTEPRYIISDILNSTATQYLIIVQACDSFTCSAPSDILRLSRSDFVTHGIRNSERELEPKDKEPQNDVDTILKQKPQQSKMTFSLLVYGLVFSVIVATLFISISVFWAVNNKMAAREFSLAANTTLTQTQTRNYQAKDDGFYSTMIPYHMSLRQNDDNFNLYNTCKRI